MKIADEDAVLIQNLYNNNNTKFVKRHVAVAAVRSKAVE